MPIEKASEEFELIELRDSFEAFASGRITNSEFQ